MANSIMILITILFLVGFLPPNIEGSIMRFPPRRLDAEEQGSGYKIRNYEENQDYTPVIVTTEGGNVGDSPGDDEGDLSTQLTRTLNPSTWTPIIVLVLFFSVIGIISAPTVVFHLNQKKIDSAKQELKRKFTLTLAPEPGFERIDEEQSETC